MNLLKQIVSIVLCGFVLAGCASAGKNFNSTRINEIQKGKTTEADLLAMFGEPMQRGQNASGVRTMMWLYSEARTRGETFIPIAGAFVGGTDTKTKTLMVTLGPDGTVTDYNYSGGGFGASGGVQEDPEKKAAKQTK